MFCVLSKDLRAGKSLLSDLDCSAVRTETAACSSTRERGTWNSNELKVLPLFTKGKET